MRTTMRKLFPLLLAVMLMIGFSTASYAAKVTGTATYDGSSLSVSDNSGTMKQTLTSMVPGDDVEIVYDLTNKSSNKTDWYVKDDIVKAFEDAAASDSGAYTYRLSYKDKDGEERVIYSNDTVGGDSSDNEAPKGLHQATNSTDKYFYLDALNAGETGSVSLEIAIDGETHNNDYQKTLSDIETNFAVQEVRSGSTGDSEDRETNNEVVTSGGSGHSNAATRTGDQMRLILYIALFAAAGIALICVIVYMIIKRRRGGSHE